MVWVYPEWIDKVQDLTIYLDNKSIKHAVGGAGKGGKEWKASLVSENGDDKEGWEL